MARTIEELSKEDIETILREHYKDLGYKVNNIEFELRETGDERFGSLGKEFAGAKCQIEKR